MHPNESCPFQKQETVKRANSGAGEYFGQSGQENTRAEPLPCDGNPWGASKYPFFSQADVRQG